MEPRAESRLKSLIWPSVSNRSDVDYLTTQGFWICFLVALDALALSLAYVNLHKLADAIFFYLGANGVRLRSWSAATAMFVFYALGMMPIGVLWQLYYASVWGTTVRIVLGALLLANLHAIWVAAKWPAAWSPRDTSGKLSGSLPGIIWPRTRHIFFVWAGLKVIAFVYVLYAVWRG